jgi:hypothetical protein
MVLWNGLRFELAERLLDLCGRELHGPLYLSVRFAGGAEGVPPSCVQLTFVHAAPSAL